MSRRAERMFEQVRGICFDLDDTLWPCEPVIRAAEQVCFDWLVDQAPDLADRYGIDELRAHRLALGGRRADIAHDLTEVRRQSLIELLAQHGYPVGLADQASDVFRAARNLVTPYDEVIDALAQLRERYVLVSVTNGNSQIEKTPLHASFDVSLTAAEVGVAKPDPRIFEVASEQTGLPLPSFLHVGDDPVRDVQAAREIGLPTVWVNRVSRPWPADVERADVEVTHLDELVEVLLG